MASVSDCCGLNGSFLCAAVQFSAVVSDTVSTDCIVVACGETALKDVRVSHQNVCSGCSA